MSKTDQLLKKYQTGIVFSADGTRIGFLNAGAGPAIVLVHGGMMSSYNFLKLGLALSDVYTVYLVDRRGRGMSGPYGNGYSLRKDVEDIEALLSATGAKKIFGLSSGAIIALQSAFQLPQIKKVAIYEPPIPLENADPAHWAARYERELEAGHLAKAMVTVMKGTADRWSFGKWPRFLITGLMNLALKSEKNGPPQNGVYLKDLIPTMHYDALLVEEMRNKINRFSTLKTEVLLMGGTRSIWFLKKTLDRLEKILPRSKRITFRGTGHLAADNGGQPEKVAAALKDFFGVD